MAITSKKRAARKRPRAATKSTRQRAPAATTKRAPAKTPSVAAKRKSSPKTTAKTTPKAPAARQQRTAKSPGKRSARRAAPAPAGNRELEQCKTQLALVEVVQRGLASGLDFQSIVDRVADRLREVLHTQDIVITWYDEQANLVHTLCCYEHGRRLPASEPYEPGAAGLFEEMRATLAPCVLCTPADYARLGAGTAPGTDASCSCAYVPIVNAGRLIGGIGLENYERENAFGPEEVATLQAAADALGVVLANARLFADTQRLLKETEQRNAELAIINSVQRALVGELSMQAVYDAVGDKLREVFHGALVNLRTYDPATDLETYPYSWSQDRRERVEPRRVGNAGFAAEVIRTCKTLVLDENVRDRMAEYGSYVLFEGGVVPKTQVMVPLVVGGQVRGIVQLNDVEREHAFSASDIRLLETLASTMSIALENARLFDETQRLLKETEQRNAELAVINSIQQGIAAELDFQAIVNLVGDKLREVLHTGDIGIRWFDEKNRLCHYLYEFEHGKRLPPVPPAPPRTGTFDDLVARRHPIVFDTLAEVLSGGTLPGTDAAKSAVLMPIVSTDRALGSIVVENHEREHAFGDAELRLLSTVASAVGTALENARLFAETQRLLKETEQRNAELAVINSVQRALAGQLSMQAVYDAVGDKLREVLHTGDIGIR